MDGRGKENQMQPPVSAKLRGRLLHEEGLHACYFQILVAIVQVTDLGKLWVDCSIGLLKILRLMTSLLFDHITLMTSLLMGHDRVSF